MPTKTIEDPLAILSEMTGKAPTKRSTKPEVSSPAIANAIDQWVEAKAQVDKWESIKVTAEAQILAFAGPARLEQCRLIGKVESSVRLNGKLTVTQKCQYSPVPAEHLADLKAAFGPDADRYFVKQLSLSLTPAATQDRALLAKLIGALGPELFRASFVAKETCSVTEAFHADYTLRPDVEETARPFLDAQVIKPYKASLR